MGVWNSLFGTNSGYSESNYVDNIDWDKQKRLERYKRSWEAYMAELPDPIIQDGPSNDNVKVNPARAMINTGVYFLFGNELKFQVSPDAAERFGTGDTTENNSPNQQKTPPWLNKLNLCWKANRKRSFFLNMGLTGGIHGDAFIKIVPNAAGESNEFPRTVLLDPANVSVVLDPDDCEKVNKWLIEYVVERPKVGAADGETEPVLRIQEITRVETGEGYEAVTTNWTMQDYEQPMGFVLGTGYVPIGGERVPVGPEVNWPYVWAPIEHTQNIELPHLFWGMPDLDESSIEVIESIQRSMSSLNKIVRIHASPRMFAKNVMPDQVDEIDVSADNIITLPNIDAELSVLQTLSNLAPSITYAEKQREMLLEMVQVPPIALGEFNTASTAISGVTLSILYAPILQKTDMKRISYGDMIERLNRKLMILMGFSPDDFESMILVWPEAMPGSSYLERQTLEQDQMMGVSEYTLHSRLGYDPVEEQKRKSQETEEQLKMQQKYAPKPEFGGGSPGGNNNPAGKGNKSGSLGGTKAAGTPKSKPGQSK